MRCFRKFATLTFTVRLSWVEHPKIVRLIRIQRLNRASSSFRLLGPTKTSSKQHSNRPLMLKKDEETQSVRNSLELINKFPGVALELINKFPGVDQQIPWSWSTNSLELINKFQQTHGVFLCLQCTTHLFCVFSAKFHHVFNHISGSSQILGVVEPTKAQIWLNTWKITMYYIDLLQQSNSPKTTFLHILLFWPSATTMSLFGFPASATTHGSISEVPRSIFSWVISLAAMPLLKMVGVCVDMNNIVYNLYRYLPRDVELTPFNNHLAPFGRSR